MNITALLTFAFLTAFTPGPANIMSMSNSSKDGLKQTLPFLGGIAIGFILVITACAAFSVTVFELIPSVQPFMLVAGASYILFLAWKIWRDKPKNGKKIMDENSFMSGFFLQFVNIKIFLYGITAITSYIQPYHKDVGTISFFCLILTIIALSANLTWALFGIAIEKIFKKQRKLLNTILAVLLVYCATSLFL